MQLDRTRVAIRERNMLDICDLAPQVIRDQSPMLLFALLVGVMPMALLNRWLLGWMVEDLMPGTFIRYLWNMTLLVFIEAPLATAAATVFLGDAMFLHPPPLKQVLRSLWKQSGRLFICQALLRGVLVAWLLAATLSPDSLTPGDFLLPLLALVLLPLRGLRPYLNEIILLERNPLRAADPRVVTIGRRSSKLHPPHSGELLVRFLGMMLLSVLLAFAVVMAGWFVMGTFFGSWRWGPVMLHVVLPGGMWVVASYMAVVRYLAYLDLRIRREGWAVELRMRAEAARLAKQMI